MTLECAYPRQPAIPPGQEIHVHQPRVYSLPSRQIKKAKKRRGDMSAIEGDGSKYEKSILGFG